MTLEQLDYNPKREHVAISQEPGQAALAEWLLYPWHPIPAISHFIIEE